MRRYLTEFIGTFFLVLTITLVVLSGTDLAPLAIGAMLMALVYLGGHVSGAHYNPAVSLAVLLRGRLSWSELWPYVGSQVAGAFAASATAYLIAGQPFSLAPAADANVLAALAVEFLFTFALALVVLNVATARATQGNSYFGLAIGFTVTAAAWAGGPISGGAYNPAVGLGPALMDGLAGGPGLWRVWIYVIGPLAGGAAAAAVFGIQNPEDVA